MKPKIHFLLILLASAMKASAVTTVASYTFDAAPVPSGWSGVNSSTISVTSGHLAVSNASSISRVTLSFDEVTLANIGDYLTVSYQIQLGTGTWDAASGSFRDVDTILWNSATDSGYGGWLTTNTGNRSRINEYTDVTGSTTPGGRTLLTSTAFNIGSSTTPWRDVTLTLTRTADGVEITYFGENSSGNVTDTMTITDESSPFLTFNAFEVTGAGGNSLNFNIDNVIITTNIPEPGSLLLGGLGLLGILRRRR